MSNINIPDPPQKPETITTHGEERVDPFYGYRYKDDKEVLNYLHAENTYADRQMADTKELQKELFAEMKGRIQETDSSAPVKKGDYYYYTRTQEGYNHPIFCRKKDVSGAEEELLWDPNQIAYTYNFFSVGEFAVSPDHKTLAYSMDTDGAELFTLYIKDLDTGIHYPEKVETARGMVWAMDSQTLVYSVMDENQHRNRIYTHTLGTPIEQDTLVLTTEDYAFRTAPLYRTSDDTYIILGVMSFTTTEMYYLSADGTDIHPTLFWEREMEHEYSIDHAHDTFYVLSNKNAPDYKLLEVPDGNTDVYERIPHRDGKVLEHIQLFENYVVVSERREGLSFVRIRDIRSGKEHEVSPSAELFHLSLEANPEFQTEIVRFSYSSFKTPTRVVEYNMRSGAWNTVKEQAVLGDFDADDYVTERRYAEAEDGALIPISMMYHRRLLNRSRNPLLLFGYGSYGMNYPMVFSSTRLSLLDRGFVFAVPHIRGSSIYGKSWHEEGRRMQKKNTFSDYITCAEWLIDHHYTSSSRLVAQGRSAGGMLMGNVANERPDLFQAMLVEVPSVEVLNTLLDEEIPGSTIHHQEWGNPKEYDVYEYIKSYDPYEHVSEQAYPHMFVRIGLHDTRVSVPQGAKWVAKLRMHKTNESLMILKTDMNAGHFGYGGRYERMKEVAEHYAFAIKMLFRGKNTSTQK